MNVAAVMSVATPSNIAPGSRIHHGCTLTGKATYATQDTTARGICQMTQSRPPQRPFYKAQRAALVNFASIDIWQRHCLTDNLPALSGVRYDAGFFVSTPAAQAL